MYLQNYSFTCRQNGQNGNIYEQHSIYINDDIRLENMLTHNTTISIMVTVKNKLTSIFVT